LTFYRRVSIIQTRWKKSVMMETLKKAIMIMIWTRESNTMQMNAIKSKDKKVKKLA